MGEPAVGQQQHLPAPQQAGRESQHAPVIPERDAGTGVPQHFPGQGGPVAAVPPGRLLQQVQQGQIGKQVYLKLHIAVLGNIYIFDMAD